MISDGSAIELVKKALGVQRATVFEGLFIALLVRFLLAMLSHHSLHAGHSGLPGIIGWRADGRFSALGRASELLALADRPSTLKAPNYFVYGPGLSAPNTIVSSAL